MHIKQMGHTGLPIPLVLQGWGQDMEQLMGILKKESEPREHKKKKKHHSRRAGILQEIKEKLQLRAQIYIYIYYIYINICIYIYAYTYLTSIHSIQ